MVRSRFNGEWGPDFEIAGIDGSGYLMRRRRDGAVLPVVVDATDVQLSGLPGAESKTRSQSPTRARDRQRAVG
jgi:hypothetical protein